MIRLRRPSAGFTLIELMVAIAVLTVVMGIVYASFSSVVASTEDARFAAQELNVRRFLSRSFTSNLHQAYENWRPGAANRESAPVLNEDGEAQDEIMVRYWFSGTDENGVFGPADELSFSTTAPMLGGLSLPGVIKQVTYKVERKDPEGGDSGDLSAIASPERQEVYLTVRETPIMGEPEDFELDNLQAPSSAADLSGQAEDVEINESVWRFPIRTFDVSYYDGAEEEWLDEWDSLEMRRLPWSVRIRVNFAKTEGEIQSDFREGIDSEEDSDFELVVPIPSGMGVTQEPPVFDRGAAPQR